MQIMNKPIRTTPRYVIGIQTDIVIEYNKNILVDSIFVFNQETYYTFYLRYTKLI